MKAVILGGYGVFGGLLAELLVQDGHAVWIAGRDRAKAETRAVKVGAQALVVDLFGDLAPAFAPEPDVIVDAAGPFQAYGDDPYRVAREAIRRGVNYLDLSDAADFTAGVAALDDAAKAAGVWVLSGASSAPGLSSIAIADLAAGFDDLLHVDIAILPGNKAPRGRSVIAAIVEGVGRPSQVWRGGIRRTVRGWTDRRRYRLAPGLERDGYFVDVPDVHLLPEALGVRSVMFRAGMELQVMNRSLRVLAAFRRWARLPLPAWGIDVLKWIAERLKPFGTDRGGMGVAVIGRANGATRQAVWTLIAEAGEGPYVPGVVARALVRAADDVRPGARPCLGELSLADVETALSDLAVTTSAETLPWAPLFQQALGSRWRELAPEVRTLHEVHDVASFSGLADVTRGRTVPARLAAKAFGFPPASADTPVTVVMTRTDAGETWTRDFGGRRFRSRLRPGEASGRVWERFGLFDFELDLPVRDGGIGFHVRRGRVLGLPIPKALLPISESRESVEDGRFRFDVSLSAPLGVGLIVRYRGWLEPDA